jgi:hypothetical protein
MIKPHYVREATGGSLGVDTEEHRDAAPAPTHDPEMGLIVRTI